MKYLITAIFLLSVDYLIAQNVGIGTTTPLMKLHIVKADSAVALLENTQTLNTNVSNAIYFKTGSGLTQYTGALKTIGESTGSARMGLFTFAAFSPNGLLERMSITDVGDVGIGTTLPLTKLHVKNIDEGVAMFENTQSLNTNINNSLYFKTGSGSFPYTGAIKTIGQNNAAARLGFFTYASGATTGLLERMSITDNGNVGIGKSNPLASLDINGDVVIGGAASVAASGYKLSVDGKAICEEIKVQLHAGWPDYVFTPGFQLLPLDELEKNIQQNRHLPNIPSAAEITADKGFAVGDMNRRLLEKVEELTLYIIELNKKNAQLTTDFVDLKKQFLALPVKQ